MGNRLNPAAILAAYGSSATYSKEENDLNVNINATHEGEDEGAEGGDNPFTAEAGAAVEEPVDTEEVEAVVEDTSGTPETAELDVQDASEEVAETADNIEDVNETAAGLEGILVTLATISHEGLQVTPLVASTIQQQFQFVTRKFPALRQGSTAISSMESLVATPEATLTDSMEAVLEGLKKAGQAFVAFLQKLWEKIKAFVGNVISGANIMKQKAAGLQKTKAGKVPDEVTVPGIANGVTAALINEATAYIRAFSSVTINVAAALKSQTKDEDQLNVLKELGVKNAEAITNNSDVGAPKLLASKQSGESTKRKPFSETEVRTIAKAVEGLADAVIAYKKIEADRKKAIEELKNVAKAQSNNSTESKPEQWRKARAAGSAVAATQTYESKVIRRALALGNATNNVLSASLGKGTSAYKEAGATTNGVAVYQG